MNELTRFGVSTCLALLLSTAAMAAQHAAVVTSTSGLVQVLHAGVKQTANTNDAVEGGDVVLTGEGASAKLLFSDDSVIDLGPSTSFKVDSFQARGAGDRVGIFSIAYGRIRALVTKAIGSESKLEIRTKDAVMGVRGTEFIVNATAGGGDRGRTSLAVINGNVAMNLPRAGGPPISVGPNTLVTAVGGMAELPKPTALSPAAVANIEHQARVVDNTFLRTVSLDAGTHNSKSPPGASPLSIAHSNVAVAAASARNEKADTSNLKATGTFSALDTLSVPIVQLLPGNLQTVTIQLSH